LVFLFIGESEKRQTRGVDKVYPWLRNCFEGCFSSVFSVSYIEYDGKSKKIILRIIRFTFFFGF